MCLFELQTTRLSTLTSWAQPLVYIRFYFLVKQYNLYEQSSTKYQFSSIFSNFSIIVLLPIHCNLSYPTYCCKRSSKSSTQSECTVVRHSYWLAIERPITVLVRKRSLSNDILEKNTIFLVSIFFFSFILSLFSVSFFLSCYAIIYIYLHKIDRILCKQSMLS